MEPNLPTWRNARFNAQARIIFTLPIGVALPELTMTRAIELADELHSWKCTYANGSQARSIEWMSSPVLKAEGDGVDRLYEVTFRPPFLLKSSELAAYYAYVVQLAHTLSRMALPNVISVMGSVDLTGTSANFHISPKDRATVPTTL